MTMRKYLMRDRARLVRLRKLSKTAAERVRHAETELRHNRETALRHNRAMALRCQDILHRAVDDMRTTLEMMR